MRDVILSPVIDDLYEEPPEDKESSGEDKSAHGSMMVGGAVSKGDGDAKMTKKQQNKILRAASVIVRAMSDGRDAMDKASSSQYKTLEAEIRNMSGQDLYHHISSNPADMAKISDESVQTRMINAGYGKQLDVLTSGTYEASQKAGRKEVMGVLMSKPLSEMTPDEQSYIWDKLVELGQADGNYNGNVDSLKSAVGSFVMSSPAHETLVSSGRVQLGAGDIKGPSPELKVSFTMANEAGRKSLTITVPRSINENIFKPSI